MNEREFNLLHEQWILVVKPDGATDEVSLLNLFRHAPEFRSLAGELPTQDVAVLRLLLAILHAAFRQADLDGRDSPPLSPATVRKRWKALWDKGAFPMEVIENYLLSYQDRFYLFHPERPFYQVAGLGKATDYSAAKLNGELAESGNKIRLFPQRTGSGKSGLHYAEAARWLLYVNAFDDTSAKPTKTGLPRPGAGWLGKLGLITAVGNNLFETLLLNLVLLKDGGNELWKEGHPVWEANVVKAAERTAITMPDNPSALLTLQSRRLLLKRKGDLVIGFALLGGDFFPKENAFAEQMTVWRSIAKKENDRQAHHPKRHAPDRQLWRDFSALIAQSEGSRRPGIVNWLALLKVTGFIPHSYFRLQTAAVKYGDKDFFIDDVFSDSLSLNVDLLTKLGKAWVSLIIEEINITEKLAAEVGHLAQALAKAAGDKDGSSQRSAAKEQAYFGLDTPFRRWLEGIDPGRDEMSEARARWREQAERIVRDLGRELIEQSGPQAFVGRDVKETKKGKTVSCRYTAPEAYNRFLYRTSTRGALTGGGKNG